MKIKNYYPTKEFALLAGISIKSLQRKKQKFLKMNSKSIRKLVVETPKGDKYRYELLKEFLSDEIYQMVIKQEKLNKREKGYKNTIDKLKNPNLLGTRLFQMDWSYFITISHKKIMTKNECYDKMSELFEELKKMRPNNEIRMYFTTEKFKNREGYHNHIILYSNKKNWLEEIIIKEYLFSHDKIDFQDYDKYNSGLFYIGKENSKGTDWDIFSTEKLNIND